jgi:Flp pilus assembly pilin Flp
VRMVGLPFDNSPRGDDGSPILCGWRWMAGLCPLRRLEMLMHLWRDTAGTSLIEYSLVIAFMIALILVGVSLAAGWASGMFSAFLR